MKREHTILGLLAILLLAFSFILPLGTYTTTQGCTADSVPNKRLSIIRGDSIQKVKSDDVAPGVTEGCSLNTRFTLYLL